jgi:hypothetical protein
MKGQELVVGKTTTPVEKREVVAVRSAINDITIAFSAGGQRSEHEMRRSLELYEKAVIGFDRRLVAEVLNWLLLHNPRNPFAPTPQDLFEACNRLDDKWRMKTLGKFGLGGRSSSEGSTVPPDIEIKFLRHAIEASLKWPQHSSTFERLIKMEEAVFIQLPVDAFPDGRRDEIVALRKEQHERDRAWRERDERETAARLQRRASSDTRSSPFSADRIRAAG